MHTSLSSVSTFKQSHPKICQRAVLSFSRQRKQKFRENNAEKLEWKGNLNLETLTDLKKFHIEKPYQLHSESKYEHNRVK